MDIVKMITGNPTLKKMLLEKFTGLAKERGIKKIMIDLQKPELELEEIPEGYVIVSENDLNYLRAYHAEHFGKKCNCKEKNN